MGKIIEVNKSISRSDHDNELTKLPAKKPSINLDKYFGTVDFGVDDLEYQLKTRNEHR